MAHDTLRDELQRSLGSSYTIERELTPGGMSRVFLAEETRFHRRVVVKVLSPELAAGISAERFEREIGIAATLQHPHIVPVLTAGEHDGTPYYTMPFVEGESLRARLAKGPLPMAEALGYLRDVAKALAYAHHHDVVHRDIKPDNVLISGSSATVADFGIAKAVSASRTRESDTALTQAGIAIGTPAYMAPEQAAGDPGTDHRADIYAFGCLAYELLTGRPPFEGSSPHKLVVAHLSERPLPIERLRPDVPQEVAALIASCLEKDPDRRPADAAALLRALDGVGDNAAPVSLAKALGIWAAAALALAVLARAAMLALGLPDWIFPGALIVAACALALTLGTWFGQRTASHIRWTRAIRWSGAGLLAFAAVVGGSTLLRAFGVGSLLAAGKLSESAKLLVAEFNVPGSDSTLGRVVAEAVRTTLSESRVIRVVPSSAVSEALERMGRTSDARLSLPIARELAQREGIPVIVSGDVAPLGGSYLLTVKLLDAASGDALASVQESAPDGNGLIPAIDRATRALRGKIGESLKLVRAAPPLQRATTPSLAALRAFTAAIEANSRGDYVDGITNIKQAIALDSNFARAYSAYGSLLQNMSAQPRLRDSLLQRAFELRYRVSDYDRLRIESQYYHTGRGFDQNRALAAAESAVTLGPGESNVWATYGLLRRDRGEFVAAESAYRRAIALAPERAILHHGLATILMDQSRWAAADSAVARSRSLTKGSDFVTQRIVVRGAYVRGRLDSTEQLARQESMSSRKDIAVDGFAVLRALDLIQGRIGAAHRVDEQLRVTQAALGVERLPLTDSLTRAMEDVWYRGDPTRAARRIAAALRAQPVERIRLEERPYLLVSRSFGLAGSVADARRWLARYDSEVKDSVTLRRDRPERAVSSLIVASLERRWNDALREVDSVSPGPTPLVFRGAATGHFWRGFVHASAGHTDEAIVSLEKFVAVRELSRITREDEEHLPFVLEKLGELYETRGEGTKAIESYRRLVELWKGADAELQPRVTEWRKRITRLERGNRGDR